ncbi:hypothetical protein BDP27DRAFT_1229240, partial [Rhodocollybia butyracea]
SNELALRRHSPSSETFHWALIHVNGNNRVTRHHWAANISDPTGPESYVKETLYAGALTASGNAPILGYFRVPEFNANIISDQALEQICRSVFPYSHPTAAHNRSVGITCRTWVKGVLLAIIGGSEYRAQIIESSVTRYSQGMNNEYGTSFLWGREFTPQKVPVDV